MAEPVHMVSRGRLGYAEGFAPALLAPDLETPQMVAGPHGKAAAKRYNVYRNNVTVSLVDALGDTFSAVRRIVGEDFFRAMARIHVRQNPPASPLLFEYGRGLADFIDRFEHARSLPYLADVARIERAWLDAYHAADALPLDAAVLAAVPPDRLAGTVFVPHPAACLVRSRFPAVTIFAVNRGDGPVGRLQTADPEDALITRPGMDVFVRRLPPGGAAFLSSLMAGVPLAAAVSTGLEEAPEFDLAANIAGMVEAGVFSAIRPANDETRREPR
jgi:hypothetical protein